MKWVFCYKLKLSFECNVILRYVGWRWGILERNIRGYLEKFNGYN